MSNDRVFVHDAYSEKVWRVCIYHTPASCIA